MRRLVLLVLAGVALSLTAAPAAVAGAAPCISASAATFSHSFHGPSGTATVTAARPLCSGQSQTFALVSYTAPGGLFVYDVARAKITSARSSVRLKVAVPSCATQVYALTGSTVLNETTSSAPAYAGTTLGSVTSRSAGPVAEYADDSAECTPTPRVTFTNACDRTFQATVTNADSANVPAVLVLGDRLIRVAPGRSTTIAAAAGATLSFRASNRTTYVGTWRAPTTGCTAAPATTASSSPASAPPALPVESLAATASPAPSQSTDAGTAADSIYRDTNPAALNAKDAGAVPADRGMSAGSVLAILLGLLLMVGGGVILTKLIQSNREPV